MLLVWDQAGAQLPLCLNAVCTGIGVKLRLSYNCAEGSGLPCSC